jgi:hypothetical protein
MVGEVMTNDITITVDRTGKTWVRYDLTALDTESLYKTVLLRANCIS